MTTKPSTEEFDYEFVAPISRFLTNLNKLQNKPKAKDSSSTKQEPDIAEVLTTAFTNATKIGETISTEIFNILDAKDSSTKEPDFNTLIKNITDIISTPSSTSNTYVATTSKPIPAGVFNSTIGAPINPAESGVFNTVIGAPITPSQPVDNIDLAPNIEPPSTNKTIKLNKPFARDIPAMFSSKYNEFSRLNLPADHEELRIKIHNDLYNAIEQAFDISIGTLTKYAVQSFPSINEVIQEHNPKIRLPASSMNELAKYLSNYSGTYNPDEKMKITSHQAKHVKFLLIDWLKTHQDMYIIV